MKKLFFGLAMTIGIALLSLVTDVTPANACNVQMGRPNSCHQGYMDSCRQLGANNPWCLNGGQQQRRMAPQQVRRPQFNQVGSHYYAQQHQRGGAYAYGRQVSGPGPMMRQPAPPAPVPSPQQIASQVPHKTTSVCVPCVDGYMQNPQTCQCDKVTWRPGPPPM